MSMSSVLSGGESSKREVVARIRNFNASQQSKEAVSRALDKKPYFYNTSWSVYKLKPSGWFKHHSLFFTPTSNTGDGFTAEIRVDGDQLVYFCEALENICVSSLNLLGCVKMSVSNIVAIALDTAAEFGKYDVTWNNCQNYCNQLSEKLRISTEWTDVGVVGVVWVWVLFSLQVQLCYWVGAMTKRTELPVFLELSLLPDITLLSQ